MATFISQVSFTDKGAEAVRETCARAEAFRQQAAALGVDVSEIFWTLGAYDGLIIFEAPDAETAAKLMFQVGAAGHVRTQTTQAFRADAVGGITSAL
ncbi:MAG: GYD domain-containing protein [Pirellulales bacterium]